VSRKNPLPSFVCLAAFALAGATAFLRADDDSANAQKAPPGYKIVDHDIGGGKKMPIFVKQDVDPLSHTRGFNDDPLDHQKVYSETNPMANKSFFGGNGASWNRASTFKDQDIYPAKVYNSAGGSRIYNFGAKSTYQTSAYAGLNPAAGYDKTFATKPADIDTNQAAAAFAAMGSSEQNRMAPIDAKPVETFADVAADKKFQGPEEEARHRHLTHPTPIDGDFQIIDNLPDRPLSIDEVKNLLNHDFKADTSKAPPPASKPLNDPDYQPQPIRIEPTSPETPPPTPGSGTKLDDDKDDPVPSPGTMADHPEDSEQLPTK
jgi:hypothetical protein